MTRAEEPPGLSRNGQDVRRRKRGLLPPEVVELLGPPLRVGTWAGCAGVLAGVGGAIATETSPVIGGLASGVNWFTLGSSFWLTRTTLVNRWGGEEHITPSQKTIASCISGGVAGAMSGLLRGPSKVLPNVAIWGATAAGGQAALDYVATRPTKVKNEEDSFLRSRWSPLKKLNDREYEELMGERILMVEADIALIDERIAALRAQAAMTGNDGQDRLQPPKS